LASCLLESPHGVSYLRPGTPVLAPPSLRPADWWRISWRECPRFPNVPAPPAETVLAIIDAVDREQWVASQSAETKPTLGLRDHSS